jgi:hypothetical protein
VLKHRVIIDYTNWRGQRALRTVAPVGVHWESDDEYHPEPQWLLWATDEDREGTPLRKFAMAGIHSWVSAPTKQPE